MNLFARSVQIDDNAIQVLDYLCLSERFALGNTNRFWNQALMKSDWVLICKTFHIKEEKILRPSTASRKRSISKNRWIPGMRVCGSPWNLGVNTEMLPKFVTNEMSMDELVFSCVGGTTNRHYLQFFENWISPCTSCRHLNLRELLPIVEKRVELLHHRDASGARNESVSRKWREPVEKIIACHRAMRLIDLLKESVSWKFRQFDAASPSKGQIIFSERSHSEPRVEVEGITSAAAMREFLLRGAPEYDVVYLQRGCTPVYDNVEHYINRHGIAVLHAYSGIVDTRFTYLLYDPFLSQAWEEFTGTDRAREQISEIFPWMNEEDELFVRNTKLFRGASNAFLSVSCSSTGLGPGYIVRNPFTGEEIINTDGMG